MVDNVAAFAAPEFKNHSPLTWYQAAAEQPGFIEDASQLKAIKLLDKLWAELMMFKRKRNRFLGRSLRSPQSPRGLYFYGGVGRGKSFLMDVFYGCLPYRRKRRVHFHAFMAEVHRRMRAHKSEANPLRAVAAQIATEVRVLCFDEFHVSDIADAMILGRLLEGLFEEGVVMVATSNYAPAELYPQGQNRASFLSTIALLERELTVLNVDGGEDYRLRSLRPADVFYVPANEDSEARLALLFAQMNHGAGPRAGTMTICGREVATRAQAVSAVWFDFDALCRTARSQTDYLWLAERYRTIFVSGIAKLDASERAQARRLTWLIDVLYDYRVKLCASCAVAVNDIYTEGDFAQEFFRTASRMTEMQSEAYLALPHLTLDAPPKA